MAMRLTEEQLDWLCEQLPDAPRNPLGGRPPTDKRLAGAGIYWMLDNGAKWKDRPREFGSKSAVHRHFTRWVQQGCLEAIMRKVGRLVETRGGGDGIGCTKAGKGVKTMVLVDARGLPLAVRTSSATPHESRLVQQLFDFMLTTQTPERMVGDKAFDSDELDEAMAARGTEVIAPHRTNRRPENTTQDGRSLRRYKRRYKVERTISWFENLRRLCIRWEKSTRMFEGDLHLGCTMLLLQVVLG